VTSRCNAWVREAEWEKLFFLVLLCCLHWQVRISCWVMLMKIIHWVEAYRI